MPQTENAIRLGVVVCDRCSLVHHLLALAHIQGFKVVAITDVEADESTA